MTRPPHLAKLLLCLLCASAASGAAPGAPHFDARPGDIQRHTITRQGAGTPSVITWDLFCTATNATTGAHWVYRQRIEPFEGSEFPMPPGVYEEGGRFDCLPDGTLLNLQGAFKHAEPGILFPLLPPGLTSTSSWSAVRSGITQYGRLQSAPDAGNPDLRFLLASTRQVSPMVRVGVKVEYTFDVARGRVRAGRMEIVDTRQPDKRSLHLLALDPTFKIADGDFAILMEDEKIVFEALDGYHLLMTRAEQGGQRELPAALEARRVLETALARAKTVFLRNELQKLLNGHEDRVSRLRRGLP